MLLERSSEKSKCNKLGNTKFVWEIKNCFGEKPSVITMEYNPKHRKPKRFRSAFTTEQLTYLEKLFKKDPYIDTEHRKEVATILKMEEKPIKIWFQNRRMKFKKDICAKEFDDETNNNVSTQEFDNDQLNNVHAMPSANDHQSSSLPTLKLHIDSKSRANIDSKIVKNIKHFVDPTDKISSNTKPTNNIECAVPYLKHNMINAKATVSNSKFTKMNNIEQSAPHLNLKNNVEESVLQTKYTNNVKQILPQPKIRNAVEKTFQHRKPNYYTECTDQTQFSPYFLRDPAPSSTISANNTNKPPQQNTSAEFSINLWKKYKQKLSAANTAACGDVAFEAQKKRQLEPEPTKTSNTTSPEDLSLRKKPNLAYVCPEPQKLVISNSPAYYPVMSTIYAPPLLSSGGVIWKPVNVMPVIATNPHAVPVPSHQGHGAHESKNCQCNCHERTHHIPVTIPPNPHNPYAQYVVAVPFHNTSSQF